MIQAHRLNLQKPHSPRLVSSRRGCLVCRGSASENGFKDDLSDVAPPISAVTAAESDLIGLVQESAEKQWLSRPIGGVSIAGKDELVPVSKLADTDDVEIPAASIVDRIMASAPVVFYMRNLEKYPLSTKCWTSFTGFFIGDVVAQALTEPEYVLSRTLILAGYGFFIDAPVGNAFYVRSISRHCPPRFHASRSSVATILFVPLASMQAILHATECPFTASV